MARPASRESRQLQRRGSLAAVDAFAAPKSFKDYVLGTFLRPRRTFDALMADPRRLRFGFYAVLIAAALYTLIYVFLTIAGGAPSTFTPWLAIPRGSYYQYNRFMLAPSMFLCWILAAGVAQLVSRAFGGMGTFEDMLSLFGLSIGVSTLISAIHDFPDSLLGALGVLDMQWYEVALNSPTIWRTIWATIYGLSFAYFFVLFPKAVGAAQRMRRGPAISIGVLAYLLYQGVFLIFNR